MPCAYVKRYLSLLCPFSSGCPELRRTSLYQIQLVPLLLVLNQLLQRTLGHIMGTNMACKQYRCCHIYIRCSANDVSDPHLCSRGSWDLTEESADESDKDWLDEPAYIPPLAPAGPGCSWPRIDALLFPAVILYYVGNRQGKVVSACKIKMYVWSWVLCQNASASALSSYSFQRLTEQLPQARDATCGF